MINSATEKKSIDDAIKLLNLGVSSEIVSQGVGLSLEKVNELYEKIKK